MTKISSALKDYEPYYEKILKTGSRVICDPPPDNTDEDYILLVLPDQRAAFETRLQLEGWELGGSLPNSGLDVDPTDQSWVLNTEHEYRGGVIDQTRLFHSWKRFETPAVYGGPGTEDSDWLLPLVSPSAGPEINLLVTCNEQYFADFTRATFLAKGLNLLEKEDRVTLFEALTRDVWPTERKKKKKKLLFERAIGTVMDHIFYADEINPINNFTGIQAVQAQQAINPTIIAHNILPGAVFEAGQAW